MVRGKHKARSISALSTVGKLTSGYYFRSPKPFQAIKVMVHDTLSATQNTVWTRVLSVILKPLPFLTLAFHFCFVLVCF